MKDEYTTILKFSSSQQIKNILDLVKNSQFEVKMSKNRFSKTALAGEVTYFF
jgi:hypothetical protein